MGPDEPLEQLQFPQLPDDQVFGHRVLLGELLLCLAVIFDHSRVDPVERGEVLEHRSLAERIVVPCADVDDGPGVP